jgi:hypothetical protein
MNANAERASLQPLLLQFELSLRGVGNPDNQPQVNITGNYQVSRPPRKSSASPTPVISTSLLLRAACTGTLEQLSSCGRPQTIAFRFSTQDVRSISDRDDNNTPQIVACSI